LRIKGVIIWFAKRSIEPVPEWFLIFEVRSAKFELRTEEFNLPLFLSDSCTVGYEF